MRSPTTDRRIMRDKDQQLKTWGFPRVMALYHPNDGIKSTEDRFNWIQAVHLDRRLTEQERLVLIRLAQYLNLKTQQCDPTVGHLAMMAGLGEGESATRMARNALSRGEALGWIRRYRRSGGRGKYNQSNSYKFLVPRDVTPAGLAERVRVQVVERDDEWYVAQVKDGVQICGPIKTREVAESWATEHGPGSLALSSPREPESLTGVSEGLTGVSEGLTGVSQRFDRSPGSSLNTEHYNSEDKSLEYTSLSRGGSNEPYQPRTLNRSAESQNKESHPAADRKNLPAGPVSAGGPPSGEPVDIESLAERVRGGRDALAPLLYGCKPMTLGRLIQSAKWGNEELDVVGFLTCGAVYRENGLIYPVGCERKPDGTYYLRGREILF